MTGGQGSRIGEGYASVEEKAPIVTLSCRIYPSARLYGTANYTNSLETFRTLNRRFPRRVILAAHHLA
jgi:hypothetical protein